MSSDCKEHGLEGECKAKTNGKHMVRMTSGRKLRGRIRGPGAPIKALLFQGKTVSKLTAEHRHDELNTHNLLFHCSSEKSNS